MKKFAEPDYDADRCVVRKVSPFSKTEFDRRQRIEIFDMPVYAATPEDVLLAKLEWAQLGESERQIRDAAGIIEIQGDKLDTVYVERWAAALDVEDELKAARQKAG